MMPHCVTRSGGRAVASVALAVAGLAVSAEARLPGTLNFSNITGTNIHQTVPEQFEDEKEVEFGDMDNDGDLDAVLAVAYSDFGARKNKLYRNDGGEFNEVSADGTIPGFVFADVTRNAFFRDYDHDGWLDIIVVNDRNSAGDAGRTKIYMNQHLGGVFDHYNEEGVARLGSGTGGAACGGVSYDFNGDGNFDIYVGNYPGPSQDTMYFSDENGFFTNMTGTHVPPDSAYTIDVVTGDMNGDGAMDILISNFSDNMLYYNNNSGAGSGPGDFSYGGSTQALGNASTNEHAMETADFDNDGDLDFYWGNRRPGESDRIYENAGNDVNNKAVFQEMPAATLPASVTTRTSRKQTVADLNGDGRLDVLVMKEAGSGSRPTILRNTTVNKQISFVDWTPGDAFPSGSTHMGWHAAAFDANGDGWKDIFLGGWVNDHLFQNTDSNEVDESDIGGTLPAIYNTDPVAVVGSAEGADGYALSGVPSGAVVSAVLNGCSDFTLEIRNSGGGLIASSNRGGLGIEEALQITAPGGDLEVRVVVNQPCGDSDGDGDLDPFDFEDFLACVATIGCQTFDFDGDGDNDFADFGAFQGNSNGPDNDGSAGYVLEVLARSN